MVGMQVQYSHTVPYSHTFVYMYMTCTNNVPSLLTWVVPTLQFTAQLALLKFDGDFAPDFGTETPLRTSCWRTSF